MRCFVALDLPDGLRRELVALQRGLQAGRPVEEDNLHLTLAFLGDIPEIQARDVAEALGEVDMPPVPLTLAGVDVPGGKTPNLIWIGAEASEALVRLHMKVETAVRGAGVTLERRRFRPHVTLARFGATLSTRDQRAIGEFLALNGAVRYAPEEADCVTLYQSHLRSDGPLYLPLAETHLTG